MAISKVTLNGETLMDVTQDTVASNNLLTGETAHGADGEPVIGAYSGGGGGETTASQKDVNLIDFDGAIRYSYTASEFANLTALPANPSHSGLTAQGWNWSLADAKAYVASYGKLWIGQMYITDDGKTRVYIHLEEGRTSPMLGCCPNGTVVVDWGDGSATETLTGTSTTDVKWTQTHNYAAAGDYVITLEVTSGTVVLCGRSGVDSCGYLLRHSSSSDGRNHSYRNAIKKIEVGASTNIGDYAFSMCYSFASATIPNGVTIIGIEAFSSCENLISITIPNSLNSIGSSAFYSCRSLSGVAIPNSLTGIGSAAFQDCYGLANITIPDSINSINNMTFQNCYSLSGIAIPNNVTSINSQAFYRCKSFSKIRFEATTPPTVAKSNAWSDIPTDCVISVPTGTLSAYTSATNYPSSSTYTYIEED